MCMGPFNYYVTLFLADFDPPLPPVTKCHTGPNPPRNARLSARPKVENLLIAYTDNTVRVKEYVNYQNNTYDILA